MLLQLFMYLCQIFSTIQTIWMGLLLSRTDEYFKNAVVISYSGKYIKLLFLFLHACSTRLNNVNSVLTTCVSPIL
jgi:hypothetical protein